MIQLSSNPHRRRLSRKLDMKLVNKIVDDEFSQVCTGLSKRINVKSTRTLMSSSGSLLPFGSLLPSNWNCSETLYERALLLMFCVLRGAKNENIHHISDIVGIPVSVLFRAYVEPHQLLRVYRLDNCTGS